MFRKTSKKILVFGLSAGFVFLMACQKTASPTVVPNIVVNLPVPVYSFETIPNWSDEFDYTGLPDAKKWGYDIGGSGWGNNELQYYTNSPKNARVENGKLIIEALKENYSGKNYTSARLLTKNKADFSYGKFVIKAKLPEGVGTWPAIWLLATNKSYGTDIWPDNGEIDIMEEVGFEPNVIYGTVHTKSFNHILGTQKSANMKIPTAISEFHEYSLEWKPNNIKILVDDKQILNFDNSQDGWSQWPFDKPFHLLLNLAIGGNWGGAKGVNDAIFPQRMEVEYVRVYGLKKE